MNAALKQMTAAGSFLIGFAVAIAAPAQGSQGRTLTGAQLGNASQITMTIPKSGTAQTAHVLRLHFTGSGGANCTMRGPAGVTVGYSHSPLSLPSSLTRTVAINVDSTAKPGSSNFTIRVPRGQCQGSNQSSTVTLRLVAAP